MTTQDTTQPLQDAPSETTAPPDDDRLQDDLFEVMVDAWGHWGDSGPHSGGYTKGQVIRRSDPDPNHYDVEHAIRTGTLRPLTVAEARMWAPQTRSGKAAAASPSAEPSTLKKPSDQAKTEG